RSERASASLQVAFRSAEAGFHSGPQSGGPRPPSRDGGGPCGGTAPVARTRGGAAAGILRAPVPSRGGPERSLRDAVVRVGTRTGRRHGGRRSGRVFRRDR